MQYNIKNDKKRNIKIIIKRGRKRKKKSYFHTIITFN